MDQPIPRLNLVVLRSSDIERLAAFYRMIGLDFLKHAHGAGPEHYSATAGDVVFELYPITRASHPTTGTRIGFQVADVDQLVAKLVASGAEVTTPAEHSPWGRRAVLNDPDGHVVELCSAKQREGDAAFLTGVRTT